MLVHKNMLFYLHQVTRGVWLNANIRSRDARQVFRMLQKLSALGSALVILQFDKNFIGINLLLSFMNLEHLLVYLRLSPMTKCQFMWNTKLQTHISQISEEKNNYDPCNKQVWKLHGLLYFSHSWTPWQKLCHLDLSIKPYRIK